MDQLKKYHVDNHTDFIANWRHFELHKLRALSKPAQSAHETRFEKAQYIRIWRIQKH